MSCEVYNGGIIALDYILKSDVERVIRRWPSAASCKVLLKSGKAWSSLAVVPETTMLKGERRGASSSILYTYILTTELGGVSEDNELLAAELMGAEYLVRATDTNGNVWILGGIKNGGRFASDDTIGQSMGEDNTMMLEYRVQDRIPMLKAT